MATDGVLIFDHPNEKIRRMDQSSEWVIARHVIDTCPVCGTEVDYGYHRGFLKSDTIERTGGCLNGHVITAYEDIGDEDDENKRVGKTFVDKQNDDRLVVTNVCDQRADEYIVTYDHEKQPVTVADFESNEEYPEDDAVVEAEYVSDRQKHGDADTYAFPISRLADADKRGALDEDLSSDDSFTNEALSDATGRSTDQDGLTKSEFFTRHVFIDRERANVVPAVMRDFSVVSHAESEDDDVDLLYIDDAEETMVRLSRDVDGDYTVEVSTIDDAETRRFSASTDAVRFAASRMCELSGDTE